MRTSAGITWLAGDHLGSTSLATNSAACPGRGSPGGAKVSDERYYPYGGTRSGSMPTDYQFTGQKRDTGTGLYYYGARYYDAVTGRFVSADTVGFKPGDPQQRNRYSYALNNPLRYTDPTGQVAQEEEAAADDLIKLLLETYGITVPKDYGWRTGYNQYGAFQYWDPGAWVMSELTMVQEAAGDMAGTMGGADTLKQRLGGVWMTMGAWGNGGLGSAHKVALGKGFNRWTVVHELSHAWDAANSWSYSWELLTITGGWYFADAYAHISYRPGGTPPKGADQNFNDSEDFAESVTTYVYPNEAQRFIGQHFSGEPKYQYADYYSLARAVWLEMRFGFRRP